MGWLSSLRFQPCFRMQWFCMFMYSICISSKKHSIQLDMLIQHVSYIHGAIRNTLELVPYSHSVRFDLSSRQSLRWPCLLRDMYLNNAWTPSALWRLAAGQKYWSISIMKEETDLKNTLDTLVFGPDCKDHAIDLGFVIPLLKRWNVVLPMGLNQKTTL